MGIVKFCAAGFAAVSLLASVPAAASVPYANGAYGSGGAEKLRRLDIMLMVTSLRCRTGADDFQSDYGRFTSAHMTELNHANGILRADMAVQFGVGAANRALDRLSTTMANRYGQGHPWLGCHELKMVANQLAELQGTPALEEAADQLLGDFATSGPSVLARR